MKPVHIHIQPLDQATNTRRDVYVGDGSSGEAFGAGGLTWEPAVIARPQMSIELFSPEMDGRVQAGKVQFSVALDQIMAVRRPRDLYWGGAPVTIYFDSPPGGGAAAADFVGSVTRFGIDRDSGKLTVSAEVSIAMIDRPLLTKTFSGGGGIGGDAGKRGAWLPAGFGAVKNIEPVWFDLVRNIGMIDGYGNTVSIDWLGEGLSSLGPRTDDYPTYAALAAAIDAGTIPPGSWGSCIAQGLVGLGAPPVAPITVHAVFGSNRAGALMRRIAEVMIGIDAGLVDAAAFAQIDADVNRPVHFWTDEQRGGKDLIEAVARSCNATPIVSFQGKLTVTRAVPSAAVATIDRTGSTEPRVIRWQPGQPNPPFLQLRARCRRPARVMRNDEVNYVDTLVDRGLFLSGESYRAGNIVWLSNGAQYLYINASPSDAHAPTAIVAPATSDTWWQQLQPPQSATDFRYSTGQTIDSLRPAEANANVTEMHTALAISGQGALATQNAVNLATQAAGQLPIGNAAAGTVNTAITIAADGTLGGAGGGVVTFGGLGGGDVGRQSEIYFGGGYLRETSGGSVASLGAFKTSIGTAAAIAGQGAFATRNSAAYGSSLLTGFGALAPREDIVYGDGFLKETSGGAPATLVNFKTSIGTAAALAGQGAFATLNSAAYGSSLLTGFGTLAPRSEMFFGDGFLRETTGGTSATLPAFKTSIGTASAISGQGAFATLNSVAYGSSYLSGFGTLAPRSEMFFGDGFLRETTGGTWASLANFKTNQGTAAAIAGQGALATKNSASWGSDVSGRPTWSTDTITAGGVPVLQAGYIYRGNGNVTDNMYDFFPRTTLSDRTSAETAAAIAGQQWAATNGTQALADNRFVAVGTNGFINSALTNTVIGWDFAGGTNSSGCSITGGRNLGGYFGRRNAAWVRTAKASGGISSSEYMFGPVSRGFNGGVSDLNRYALPVKQGDRVYVSGRFAVHGGANVKVRVRLWNEAGSLITEADGYGTHADARFGGPSGVNGDNYVFVECFFSVPAGCSYAAWGCYAFASGGQADMYIFAADPVLSVIPPGQVAGLPYVPGSPDRASDATVENTAAAIAGQGALATLNAISLATQATGKIPDGRSLSASNNFGVRALSSVGAAYDYVSGGDPYIHIDASTFYGDWGGSVTYPAANFGPVSYGDTFYIWRNVTSADSAGSSYGCTPYASDILGVDKVFLRQITVRASSGAGGTTGTGTGTVVTGTGGGGSGYNIP